MLNNGLMQVLQTGYQVESYVRYNNLNASIASDFCSEDHLGTYYLITFNPSSLPHEYNQIKIAKELQTMVDEITQSIKYLFDCRV